MPRAACKISATARYMKRRSPLIHVLIATPWILGGENCDAVLILNVRAEKIFLMASLKAMYGVHKRGHSCKETARPRIPTASSKAVL